MAPTASLDALPNEILYEILKYLTKKTDAAIPRRYQICNTFACLNRRLRQFALPHVFNEIRVPNYKRLPNMIDQFKEHLSLIRSIRVGHGPLRKSEAGLSEECLWPLSLLPEAERIAQLCNLTNFDCLGFCFDPDVLEVTFGTVNTRLQSFRLGWDDGSAFPFEAFPSLESLHIYVIPHSFNGSERQLCASQSPSLTALSVIDADAAWFEQNICGRVTFPNLRVLNILPSGFSYDAILIFISEHPTLTAVNIPRIYIPFPEFVTLVKGERHSTRSDDSGIRTRAPPDDPAFHEWSEVELASFAFVCESEKRPQSPSRIVTELSIESSYEGGPLLLSTLGALGSRPLFTECTRLSFVDHGLDDPSWEEVALIMTELINGLAQWKHLRYFYLGCPFPKVWDFVLPLSDFLVDDVLPMRDGRPVDFKGYCEMARFSPEEVEEFRQDVIDWGFECRDDTCVMPLWEARRQLEMEWWVRLLAEACPTLEVFEWSIREDQFEPYELSMGECAHPPLWIWKIYKDAAGGVRLVSGNLTWNGRLNHPSSCLGEQFKKCKF